jgi:cytochrome c oxidase assembly protein subunit 15
VRWLAGGAFFGTLLQAPLGAITVYYHLNPWLVLTHFLLSLVVLGLGVLVAIEAWDVRGEPVPRRLRELALVVGVACCVLIGTGTLATAAGPHSGGVDVPRVGSFQPAVWLHVRAVAVFAIAFLALITWLRARGSAHVRPALGVLGLLVLEMIVGEIQYRTHLPWGLVLVHVTLAAAVFAATVAFVARMWRPSRMA